VTTGCSAALTHATLACVTGGNPDLHIRIPDLRGFAKDECIIPQHSRNVYDAAVRAVGCASSPSPRRGAGSGLRSAHGPSPTSSPAQRGRRSAQHQGHLRGREPAGRPVLVDAAAEIFTVPTCT